MIKFVVLLMLIACVACDDDEKWKQFKSKHGKKYDNSSHEAQRKDIFVQNAKGVDEHNAKHAAGKVGFSKALYEFADQTNAEVRAVKSCVIKPTTSRALPQSYPSPNDFPTATASFVDYRPQLQPVVDQGNCGACWAFTTIAQLEYLSKVKNSNFNTQLSQQFLVDCDTNDQGCNGGFVANGLGFLQSKGAVAASDYPYTDSQGQCQSKQMIPNVISNIANFDSYTQGLNEANMANILAKDGPFGILVNVSPSFLNYKSGVLDDTRCGGCISTDHAVLLVGYGTDTINGAIQPYWLVRNSWGPTWGEAGYLRIRRGNNICGLACSAIYAT